jgi:hypothetical protein
MCTVIERALASRPVPRLVLGPLLRHVTETTATVWVETDSACTVEILGRRATTFAVADHHYALVIVVGLQPATITPYDLRLDGERVWPPPLSRFPPSVIRTLGKGPLRILFGSCRAAAPHEPPWTLAAECDARARGVDALYAYGLRMLSQDAAEWPDLLLFVGDQVYADDASPATRTKVEARRGHLTDDDRFPSLDDVADFEEYTWLYQESWLPEVERWVLSVVPSAMIFDDHDMVDDWNTSMSWVDGIRRQPWWEDHVIGGLMSYWVYQHLGNLSPEEIRAEGMLDAFVEMGDATNALREWALESDEFTPVPGGYRFSFHRDLGAVRVVVIDSRNGRVLTPRARQMVDDDEWAWIVERADVACEHLVLATSVPVVMPGGLHDLEQWNERICDGAWGRRMAGVGERIRRALDLEDWAAFHSSHERLMELLRTIATPREAPAPKPPATVTILSGDVHFSYRATAALPPEPGHAEPTSRLHQIVNSPIRNVLRPRERRALRVASSWIGASIGRGLRRASGARPDPTRWEIVDGPFFANHVCILEFAGDRATMTFERSEAGSGASPVLTVATRSEL